MHQHAFGGRVPPGPAGGAQELAKLLVTAEGEGTGKRGREREKKEGGEV